MSRVVANDKMLKSAVVASSAAKWGVLPVVVGWREVPTVSSATSRVCWRLLSGLQHEDLS